MHLFEKIDVAIYPSYKLQTAYEQVIRLLGDSGSSVSVTDITLASALLQFKQDNLFLLTENHTELPFNFFEPIFIVNKIGKKQIKNIVFYKINRAAIDKSKRLN